MNEIITASMTDLYRQAKDTGEEYFDRAKMVLEESGLPYGASDCINLANTLQKEFQSCSFQKMYEHRSLLISSSLTELANGVFDLAHTIDPEEGECCAKADY